MEVTVNSRWYRVWEWVARRVFGWAYRKRLHAEERRRYATQILPVPSG